MSKFAALASNLTDAFNMPILSPNTEAVLKDADGREAFISLLSSESEPGRKADRAYTLAKARKSHSGRNQVSLDDVDAFLDHQIEKLTVLTTGWHMVDLDGNFIDVPFSPQNARELWSDPGLEWLRMQAWTFVSAAANFMPRSSKT